MACLLFLMDIWIVLDLAKITNHLSGVYNVYNAVAKTLAAAFGSSHVFYLPWLLVSLCSYRV